MFLEKDRHPYRLTVYDPFTDKWNYYLSGDCLDPSGEIPFSAERVRDDLLAVIREIRGLGFIGGIFTPQSRREGYCLGVEVGHEDWKGRPTGVVLESKFRRGAAGAARIYRHILYGNGVGIWQVIESHRRGFELIWERILDERFITVSDLPAIEAIVLGVSESMSGNNLTRWNQFF